MADLVNDVKSLFATGLANSQAAFNKPVSLFIGATGAGKSTAINYLAGAQMVKKLDMFAANGYTIETPNPVVAIGSGSQSKTATCQVILSEDHPALDGLNVVDCPGFHDTRGLAYEIAGAMSIFEVLQKFASIKSIVVLIDFYSITTNRGEAFHQTINQVGQLVNDFSVIRDSLVFLITKNSPRVTAAAVATALRQGILSLPSLTNKGRQFVDAMLREGGRYIFVCNPLLPDQRQGIIDAIKPIHTTPSASIRQHFNFSLSNGAQRAVLDIVSNVTSEGFELFRSAGSKLEEIYTLAFEDAVMDDTGKQLRDLVMSLETLKGKLLSLSSVNLESMVPLLLAQDAKLHQVATDMKNKNEVLTLLASLLTVNRVYHDHVGATDDASVRTYLVQKIDIASAKAQHLICDEIIRKLLAGVFSIPKIRSHSHDVERELAGWLSSTTQSVSSFETSIERIIASNAQSEPEVKYPLLRANYSFQSVRDMAMPVMRVYARKFLQSSLTYPTSVAEISGGTVRVSCLGEVSSSAVSEILNHVRPLLLAAGSQFTTLQVIVRGTLFFDSDLSLDIFSGKNVVILCKEVDLSSKPCVIDVSGAAGDDIYQGHAAAVGATGGSGDDASPAGDVYLVFDKIVAGAGGGLTIKANGALGGMGQKGGNGARGADGLNGADASEDTKGAKITSDISPLQGAPGGAGGDGRRGLKGGSSGKGSSAGSIIIYSVMDYGKLITKESQPGVPGNVGDGGGGGRGGSGGTGGRNGIEMKSGQKYLAGSPTFDRMWDSVVEIPGHFIFSKRAEDGAAGTDGVSGQSGDLVTELVTNPSPLGSKDLADILLFAFFSTSNGLSFQHKSNILTLLYNCGAFTSEFAFEIMTDVNSATRNPYLPTVTLNSGNKDAKLLKLQFFRAFEKLLNRDTQKISGSDRKWHFIYLRVLQTTYFLENEVGEKVNFGGKVLNFYTYCEYIDTFVKAFQRLSDDEKKRQYGNDFNDRIQQQIQSGRQAISSIKAKIDSDIDATQGEVTSVLEELEGLKEQEMHHHDELEAKRNELQSKLKTSLGLGIFNSILGILGSLSGSFAIFSGICTSMEGVAQNQATNELAITDLKEDMDLRDRLDATRRSYATELEKIRRIDGLSVEEELKSLKALSPEDLERFGREVSRTATMRERDMLKNELIIKLPRTSSEEKQAARAALDGYKQDAAAAFAVRQAQLDELEKEQDIRSDATKMENLRSYSNYLDRQRVSLRKQQLSRGIAGGAGFVSGIASSVATCMSITASSKGQLAEINNAIAVSHDNIQALSQLHNQTETFKNKLNTSIRTFLDNAQAQFANLDQFQTALSTLDVRAQFNSLKQFLDTLKSVATKTTGPLLRRVQEMEYKIDVEVSLYDKIENQKDQLRMGSLIVGVASNSLISSMSPEERNYRKAAAVSYLKTLALDEIDTFLLFSFPFGMHAIAQTMTPTQNLIQRHDGITENQLVDTIRELNNSIFKVLQLDRASVQAFDTNILYHEFLPSDPYATLRAIDLPHQFELLRVGEEATFHIDSIQNSKDVIKYITLYLEITSPSLSDALKNNLMVKFTLTDEMDFCLRPASPTAGLKREIYSFPQEDVTINHSVKLAVHTGQGVDCIQSADDARMLLKYRLNKMWSGRSPFTTMLVQMNHLDMSVMQGHRTIGVDVADNADVKAKIGELFGMGNDQVNIRHCFEEILDDLSRIKWLERTGNNWNIKPTWAEMSGSSHLQSKLGYGGKQEAFVKALLLEHMSLFGTPDSLANFEMKLVGYGTWVQSIWGSQNISREAYARWKKVEPAAVATAV